MKQKELLVDVSEFFLDRRKIGVMIDDDVAKILLEGRTLALVSFLSLKRAKREVCQ